MDYEKMFKKLVHKVDRGYVLANLTKSGIVERPEGWTDDFVNGVIGAYECIEKKIQELAKEEG